MSQEDAATARPTTAKARPIKRLLSPLGRQLQLSYSIEQMRTIEQMKQRQLAVLLSNQVPQCCNKGTPLLLGRDTTSLHQPRSGFGTAPRSAALKQYHGSHEAPPNKGLLGPGMYDVVCCRSGTPLDMGRRPTTAPPPSGFGSTSKRFQEPSRFERAGSSAEIPRIDVACSRSGVPLGTRQQGTAASLRVGTRGAVLYGGRASERHVAYGRGSYGPGANRARPALP